MVKKLYLENLHCSSCATKIEDRLSLEKGIDGVRINFNTKEISYSSKNNMLKKIKNIIKDIEPDITVKDSSINTNTVSILDYIDKKSLIAIAVSILLSIIGWKVFTVSPLTPLVFLIAYLISGWDIVKKAFKNLKDARFLDENFLMVLASVGAFYIGDFLEAVAIVIFYKIGDVFKNYAVNKSRGLIDSLIDISPTYVSLKKNSKIERVEPDSVDIGDTILVNKGESVPIDGTLLSQKATFDSSFITGEFKPKRVLKEEEVLSGYINSDDSVYIKTKATFSNSIMSKIITMLKDASSKKSQSEEFMTKFARYYTPIVVVLAFFIAFIPPVFIEGAIQQDWIRKALIFLIISCPCALVVSIPLSFFSGIGLSSKNGILIKGANYLERLSGIKHVVFDKTGTLTKGTFSVRKVISISSSKEQVLKIATLCEQFSTHPIAKSIIKEYNKPLLNTSIVNSKEFDGLGVSSVIEGVRYFVGNDKLLKKHNIEHEIIDETLTTVYVADDKKVLGYLLIGDTIKKSAFNLVKELKSIGIKSVFMLTGDKNSVASYVANKIGIKDFKAQLLPQDKLIMYDEFKASHKGSIAFVGDGINDAPLLKRSDVGVCMAKDGNDISIFSSDVTINSDDISKVTTSIKIAKDTNKVAYENIILSVGTKFLVLGLGAFGMATVSYAILADVGVTILAVLNSVKILYKKY